MSELAENFSLSDADSFDHVAAGIWSVVSMLMVVSACLIHVTALNFLYPSYFHSQEGYCPVFFFFFKSKDGNQPVLLCLAYV